MPMRLALTGNLHGPDVGEQLVLLQQARQPGALPQAAACDTLDMRLAQLKAWLDAHPA